MLKMWARQGLLGVIALSATLGPCWAGDSLYGRITAVRDATLVTMNYGTGAYELRVVGIETPKPEEARKFVSDLLLGRNARMRLHRRAANGEMVCRLFTDDPVLGIKEVGVEMLRAGVARRLLDYDEKYGELAAAESEAKAALRGIWAPASK